MQSLTRRGIGSTAAAAEAGIVAAPMIDGAARARAVRLMMSHLHPTGAKGKAFVEATMAA